MKMNYFVFGTSDMQASIRFYDALFESSEITKIHSEGRMTLWAGEGFMFAVAEPFDGEEASFGNGTMVGFNLDSSEKVEDIYKKALELGGTDEGKPAIRSDRFSAYFRDLDKNKICLYV
ncbi:MAG: glyoxalase [SAR86 cluster bacterium]|uniref:Glyoxalase n=1 Tax=SAR86 cluster bacterium TaxID=2030880 RepID=A0A2A4MKV3_9GAMM|nr:MAG: glyoxalase [SAR86 cluster bacterium]